MVGAPCLRFFLFKNAVGSVGWRFFAFSGLCCVTYSSVVLVGFSYAISLGSWDGKKSKENGRGGKWIEI